MNHCLAALIYIDLVLREYCKHARIELTREHGGKEKDYFETVISYKNICTLKF